ncbi:hypothetical protein GCM10009633_19240 [Janibacter melonis]|uniref:DUF4265 domain-containing protein n=1 Tax=Janibacter melonis TaxID=262209 RepID=UPI001E62A799|nr:DUF4265 domain-containing protein [Janibacter melonis]MCB5991758.1 DUF4265 domain-containing protein [Janibacter melonis]
MNVGKYALHEHPVWRDRSNYIVQAPLNIEDDLETELEFEQLWTRQIDDSHFELCCIPFFLYDVALGDVLEVSEEGVVRRVKSTSGRYVFRVWLGDDGYPRSKVEADLISLGSLTEWASNDLLAVDARNLSHAQEVADYLQMQANSGRLEFETGKQT